MKWYPVVVFHILQVILYLLIKDFMYEYGLQKDNRDSSTATVISVVISSIFGWVLSWNILFIISKIYNPLIKSPHLSESDMPIMMFIR